eukprot:g12990.t1
MCPTCTSEAPATVNCEPRRETEASLAIDASDVRGPNDEEEGRWEGSDAIHDSDSPSPSRVPRKRGGGGGGISVARRNGALCLALCVSATSLMWIISRDDAGPAYSGLDTLGPLANQKLSTGAKRASASGRVELTRESNDLEQGSEKAGYRSKAAFHRAAAAASAAAAATEEKEEPEQQHHQHQQNLPPPPPPPQQQQQQQQRRSQQDRTRRVDRFTRQQQQQQQQHGQRRADAASAAAGARVARDAAEVALRAAVSDGSFVPGPAARGDGGRASLSLSGKDTTGSPNDEGRADIERGWRSVAYAGGGTDGSSELSVEAAGGKAVAKTWRVVTGDEEGRRSPSALRDVEGVGRWGTFEEVPVDGGATIDRTPVDLDAEERAASEKTGAFVAGQAAPAAEEETPPKEYNIGSVEKAKTEEEERPLNDEGGAGAPSPGTSGSERPAGGSISSSGGVGVYLGGVSDGVKPFPDPAGSPSTIPTAVASGALEAEQGVRHRGGLGGVPGERRQVDGEKDGAAGGIRGGEEAPGKEDTPGERTPKFEDHMRGEKKERTVDENEEVVRVQNDGPAINDERVTKEAAGAPPPEAVEAEAAAPLSREAGTSNVTKSKEGGRVAPDIAPVPAHSRRDALSGIREANLRAKEIRASTRSRPANVVEEEELKPADGGDRTEALPEQAKQAVSAEKRPVVRLPSRHADRWEQARQRGGDNNGDNSGTGLGKHAREAAEAALVGVPPLVPGGGGSSNGGQRGGDKGEGLPCRLEGRVEDWKPPAIADLRSSYRWTDEHKASMDRIRRFRQGGSALRELIHAEVIRLDVLRHDLFC